MIWSGDKTLIKHTLWMWKNFSWLCTLIPDSNNLVKGMLGFQQTKKYFGMKADELKKKINKNKVTNFSGLNFLKSFAIWFFTIQYVTNYHKLHNIYTVHHNSTCFKHQIVHHLSNASPATCARCFFVVVLNMFLLAE